MASKSLLVLGVLLASVLLISFEVAARELAEQNEKANELEDQKYGGGYQGHYGGGSGGYPGHGGGGGGYAWDKRMEVVEDTLDTVEEVEDNPGTRWRRRRIPWTRWRRWKDPWTRWRGGGYAGHGPGTGSCIPDGCCGHGYARWLPMLCHCQRGSRC
ncbi:uncharacterized protein LOC109840109 isoform X2 [Asparagus officinalis]|uniref:uncharacterized protein LOC109840109 isoform X2 n=1 Tax=Asparagus officinalis TaxID=4686 RepID=UPI00098E2EBE|nr:uncharacterized protein LOC109840109 isoform X2 [Asparagus officinalis]